MIDSKAKAFWTGPYLFDQFWADLWYESRGEALEPPAIGAPLYGQHQMLPIGPFEDAGRYDAHLWWWTGRPANELLMKPPQGGPPHSSPDPQPAEESFSFYVK